jgi:hypothetical protein
MPIAEYNILLQKTDALVINSSKQMALGNIFIAIQNGLKIYLNKNNDILNWLISNNLHVFTIKDFEIDLKLGNTKSFKILR